MSMNCIKYSIIVPVHNAIKYLPSCIDSVTSQDFSNYELIISDDHSTDGTTDFLNKLKHPKIKVFFTPKRLSMVEHFEFALTHARGDWCMFLGGDDGLQLYFFELAEYLTGVATEKKLRAIMSERAYYFWKGCDRLYGNTAVSYSAQARIKILDSRYQSLLTLLGFQAYFELPQMYTTSLFKKSLLDEVKNSLEGHIFSTIPPDANLGAIACSLEKKYLKSFIPLGWIGTSPSGVLYTMDSVDTTALPKNIEYDLNSGNFALRSCSIYYWNALLRTKKLRSDIYNSILTSYFLKALIFAGVSHEIRTSSNIDSRTRLIFYEELIKINNMGRLLIFFFKVSLSFLQKAYLYKSRLAGAICRLKFKSVTYKKDWKGNENLNMTSASRDIYQSLDKKNILNTLVAAPPKRVNI